MEVADDWIGRRVVCPHCGKNVTVSFRPRAASSPAVRGAARRVRGQALTLEVLSGLSFLAAAFLLLLFFLKPDAIAFDPAYVPGALFVLSVQLYLVAQIVHIRANTEK